MNIRLLSRLFFSPSLLPSVPLLHSDEKMIYYSFDRKGRTISIEVEEGQEYRVGLLSLEIKSITSDTIVFSIWPKDPVTLKKGEPYLFTKTLSGYTDHEGCDWDGTDYDYTIRWVR